MGQWTAGWSSVVREWRLTLAPTKGARSDVAAVSADLHAQPKRLDVVCAVLQRVHAEAEALSAEGTPGIIFLGAPSLSQAAATGCLKDGLSKSRPAGDFWDKNGPLLVPMLNRLIDQLSSWTVPSVFLVGNHDQARLVCCSKVHSQGLCSIWLPGCRLTWEVKSMRCTPWLQLALI